jgi:RNA polymerase sigma-70 factor (ECF subfamily)
MAVWRINRHEMRASRPPDTDDSFDDLVVLARTDRDAFGRLFDLYYANVLRYCQRRLFVRAVAEDVTSQVFLNVATRMPNFSGTTQDDFIRWLFRIATNEINAHVRRTKRRERLLEAAARAKRLCVAGQTHMSNAEFEALDWPTLYEAIMSLKPREQSMIALRFFEQMSHAQIADVLQQRPVTVRVALSRAMQKLRRILGVENDTSVPASDDRANP